MLLICASITPRCYAAAMPLTSPLLPPLPDAHFRPLDIPEAACWHSVRPPISLCHDIAMLIAARSAEMPFFLPSMPIFFGAAFSDAGAALPRRRLMLMIFCHGFSLFVDADTMPVRCARCHAAVAAARCTHVATRRFTSPPRCHACYVARFYAYAATI